MTTLVPTRPPRAHQAAALHKAEGHRSFFYLLEMGTGKSKIAIDEALQLALDGKIDRMLVVAGKGSYADWVHKHLPENVPADLPVVAHLWRGGHTKREREGLRYLTYGAPLLRVLVMNVEALGVAGAAATVAQNFVAGGETMLVCDESTKIRNVGARRTKRMIELAQFARYRRALTGLATPKNPLDLWGQMEFLDLSYMLARNWFQFRARYCIMSSKSFQVRGAHAGTMKQAMQIVGYRNLDELQRKMEPVSFRALKAECLDLPPKIYERAEVEMTPEQSGAYRDMLKTATVELENGYFASARNAVARLLRLHQITCGFLVDEEGHSHELPCAKLSILTDTIDEMQGQVIIWCAYQHDVLAVTRRLEETYPARRVAQYYGPTKSEARAAAVEGFQRGEIDFFVGTAATGGFGITLTAAHNVIYYSNSFDLEHRLQSEDRCHRDGQHHPVTYVDLVTPRTVEDKILKTLQAKKSVADTVMGDGMREWLKWEEDET
jgi:SNF2 family DNA or RNA helicase